MQFNKGEYVWLFHDGNELHTLGRVHDIGLARSGEVGRDRSLMIRSAFNSEVSLSYNSSNDDDIPQILWPRYVQKYKDWPDGLRREQA